MDKSVVEQWGSSSSTCGVLLDLLDLVATFHPNISPDGVSQDVTSRFSFVCVDWFLNVLLFFNSLYVAICMCECWEKKECE